MSWCQLASGVLYNLLGGWRREQAPGTAPEPWWPCHLAPRSGQARELRGALLVSVVVGSSLLPRHSVCCGHS